MSRPGPSDFVAPQSKKPAEPRPSASIVLLSPTNQVLLLHRVETSTSFASAHVFPGGNVDAFHDGEVPGPEAPEARHADGPAYRMGAVRECFEESGILLATCAVQGKGLIELDGAVREKARKEVHEHRVRFGDWLNSIGGVADVDGLIPFTRWITPLGGPKRFTTQMYIYMLPLSLPSGAAAVRKESIVPVPDGGIEHTAATFDDASSWLAKARAREILLLPPQYFLLALLAKFLTGSGSRSTAELRAQRDGLVAFLRAVPTATSPKAAAHPTAQIPWADKVISPTVLAKRKGDGRIVLGLDKAGPELKDSGRGGDLERVVLVRFIKVGAADVEVRNREEVFEEERRAAAEEDRGRDGKL